MIQDLVNDAYEAVVSLSLRGPGGQVQDIDAVIDTWYIGFLTLTTTLTQPGTTWEEAFDVAFGMTVGESFELFEEHSAAGFPEVEIPAHAPRRLNGE